VMWTTWSRDCLTSSEELDMSYRTTDAIMIIALAAVLACGLILTVQAWLDCDGMFQVAPLACDVSE